MNKRDTLIEINIPKISFHIGIRWMWRKRAIVEHSPSKWCYEWLCLEISGEK